MSDDEAGTHKRSSEATRTAERQSERRFHARFPFTAFVEAIEPQSHVKLSARTSDLSLGGCYVDTMNPYAPGTAIKIRLTKDKETFEADAKVLFSHAGMGMGVAFVSAMPRQLRIFQNWLNELTGKSSTGTEEPKKSEALAAAADSTKGLYFVLHELLLALIKKGVLGEAEGKALLQRLYR